MTKSFDFDLEILESESNDSIFFKITRQNHLILILKFSNQNQMI